MATDDAVALLDQLSYAQIVFLVTAADTNVLAFEPRDDPMIAWLLGLGFLDSVPDVDPTHEIIRISSKGRRVVNLIMEERESPSEAARGHLRIGGEHFPFDVAGFSHH